MIDINCDVGEGLENEHLLMPFITSCNISCGAHAGSVEDIDRVISLAKQHKVKIGAHPSFPDKENFGRKIMKMNHTELMSTLVEQMLLFKERATLQNMTIHHVKPHGALYNLIAVNEEAAKTVVAAVRQVFNTIKIYVPYQSEIARIADGELEIVYEAFADRNYNDNLTLVSRNETNAIINKPEEVFSHVNLMTNSSMVKTISGAKKTIKADTFCVHGDNENAIKILKYLHEYFNKN